ncbi:hypothetical protein EHM69_04635 [candidate division KSB1 bacterium]|nr:MAG: hypothetical protein EHM69_04635 [candidate division KSB1 bacterium]
MGCAAGHALRNAGSDSDYAETALHAYLDRLDMWRSMSTKIKLHVVTNEARFRARGHLLYLTGERYEVGFVKPYDRLLGNFYITPDQVIYWDLTISPRTFNVEEPPDLKELIPVGLSNWNIRDLLPFPVGGRSGGLRVDSIWNHDGRVFVSAFCDSAQHILTLSGRGGYIESERIQRPGHDVMLKQYGKYHNYHGWPIPHKTICMDSTATIRLTWTLSDMELDAIEFTYDPYQPSHAEPSP